MTVDARSKTLEDELLLLLAKQSRRVPVAAFLAAAIITLFASRHFSTSIALLWLLSVSAVLAVRYFVLQRLPDLKHRSYQNRIQIAVSLSLLNGVMFAASLAIFPLMPELERTIQSVILVALCTGAVATTAGHRSIFLAFMLPCFAAMVPLWILSPGLESAGSTEIGLGLLIFMFGAILVGLARDAWRVFRESFEIRSEVLKLNKQLSKALKDAEAANNAKTRFLASASHDLRQPIHTLSLFSAALSMQKLDAPSRDIADHMNVALQNLASQLDSLLDISKLDAGVMDKNLTRVELKNVLLNLEQEYRRVCDEKGLTLKCGLLEDLPAIKTDALLLERILRNLISNAIKYTDEGSIYLTTTRRSGQLVIRISDTGRGIPRSEQPHIFEEFYQIDNPERDRSKGLGLGLSIVKRLAGMLDYELHMESTVGIGSKFEIMLPKSIEIQHTESPDIAGDKPRPPTDKSTRILVIDDEAAVRAGMQSLLTSMGYLVDLAEGMEDALNLARANKPNLVLADLRLRGTENGIDCVHAIRDFIPDVPALLISGDTAPNRLKGARLAGLEILHKPVDVTQLQNSIQSLCADYEVLYEHPDVRARA